MNEQSFPDPPTAVESIEPETLKARIDDGEDVFVLDTRVESEYEEWRIDGPTVGSANIPYFDFFEDYDPSLLDPLPEDREIVVLCAKGGSSEYVAGDLVEAGYDAVHLAEGMNGWAAIYEAVPVTGYDGAGELIQYQRPSSGCLGYLLVDGGEAAVIDPLRTFRDRYVADATARGADLTYAIDTHIHADHLSGVRELDDEPGVRGVIPEAAVARGVTYADELATAGHGETFAVGDATIEVVETPGHTTGMTSFLVDGSVLLTGDGLFTESVARPDLEEGDDGAPEAARLLYESLQEEVLALPDDVLVGGAHFSDAGDPADDGTYTAPIGELREEMDALTMAEPDFVDLILSNMPPRPANYEEIIERNLGLQPIDDEAEAFRLELGPNNCAASQDALTGD